MGLSEISILLVAAAGFGIVAKIFKQPPLIGYVFAGIFLALSKILVESAATDQLGQIGVTLLLFLVGLQMNIREVPTIGKVALISATAQIVITTLLGLGFSFFLGFNYLTAFYISIALTLSSTIIVVKLLSEKDDLNSLYGKITVGFLLVQDFFVIALIMLLTGVGRGEVSIYNYLILTVKAALLFVSVWLFSKKILPKIFDKFLSGGSELIFIGSIAWALGVASFVSGPLGFSFEIGGFLAGLALSNLPEHLQIASRTRPLRDFFLTLFFLTLGTKIVVPNFISILPTALVLSFFVILVKPLIFLSILGFMGYKRRTSFFSAVSTSQVSEFSFILMGLAAALGHVQMEDVALIILVGVITMIISTYFISSTEKIYVFVKDFLEIFERKSPKEISYLKEIPFNDHVVLVGCDRTGKSLASFFIKDGIPLLVVDFNPKVFERLTADNIPVVFGDINDPDILEITQIEKAKIVISTISNLADNLVLLEHIRRIKNRPITILKAANSEDAVKFYEAGASFVIVPEVVAGEYIRHLLRTYGIAPERIKKMGKSHFNRLMSK